MPAIPLRVSPKRRILLIVVLVMLRLSTPVLAQRRNELFPEARIRIQWRDSVDQRPRVAVGQFIGLHRDSILVARPAPLPAVAIPLALVRALELQSRRSSWRLGFTLGALAGAVAGYALAPRSHDVCLTDISGGTAACIDATLVPIAGAFGGAVLGSLAGALIGSGFTHQEWQRVRVPVPLP
jgi:hypothetical protein